VLERIAHYRVMREIGRGAMGRVYLAYDERIQRQVAVKELLLPEGLGEEERREAVERFKREAQAAGKLSHPNIVTVHSVEEDQLGNPYIVMEYLEGVTLGEALRQGPLSPERAIAIVSQVLEALEYAHQRGVVHRDIKPDNVFLLYDGRVKVADFGIARVATTSTMTQVGTVMGSPGYMSPEQVRGEIVDHRSDIFSCGVLLYELLCGVNPFSPGDATAVMYRVVHEDPLPLTRRDPSLPPYLEAVVARATAKQREARYQSAAEMRRDLLSGSFPRPAPGTVVVGAPASPTVHLAPPGPAHPTVVRPQPPVAGAPPSSRRRTSLWVLVSVLAVLLAGGGILAFFLLSSPRVQVPDLVGISEDEARSLLQKNGLSMEVEEVSLPGFEEGEVVSQVPAAGQKVDKGSRVRVEVHRSSPIGEMSRGDQEYISQMDGMIATLSGLDSRIRDTATEINASIDAAGHRMKKNMRPQCDALMGELRSLRGKAAGLSPPARFSSLHAQFLQLVDYCIARVEAFYAGIAAVESGGDYEAAFKAGVAPKDAYTTLFPSFVREYNALKSQ